MTSDRGLVERNALLAEELLAARRELQKALALADDRERDLAPYEEEIDTLRKERNEAQGQVEALGEQLCRYHDTNPLNAVVLELERERDEAQECARQMVHAALTDFSKPLPLARELVAKHPFLRCAAPKP